jgi:hypothetical protein
MNIALTYYNGSGILSNAQSDFLSCQYGGGTIQQTLQNMRVLWIIQEDIGTQSICILSARGKRKLVSHCWECCIDQDNKPDLKIADHKYHAYDILLETIKQLTLNKTKSGRCGIKFENAVKKSCKENSFEA